MGHRSGAEAHLSAKTENVQDCCGGYVKLHSVLKKVDQFVSRPQLRWNGGFWRGVLTLTCLSWR